MNGSGDATTLGQIVILIGLILTAITQIVVAYINHGQFKTQATRVEVAAAEVKRDNADRNEELRHVVVDTAATIKADAQRAYDAANHLNEKIAEMGARFDKLVPVEESAPGEIERVAKETKAKVEELATVKNVRKREG